MSRSLGSPSPPARPLRGPSPPARPLRGPSPPARPFRGAVFDLFHTLADPEAFRPPDFHRMLFTAGYFGLDPARLQPAWEADTRRRVVDGTRTLLVFLEEYFRAEGLAWPPEADLGRFDREVGRYQDQALLEPVPGAVASLAAIRAAGLRLGLLSNAEERDCRAWATSPLRPLFDVVRFSFETGHRKPAPEAYAGVLKGLGLPAADCAYLGDGGGDELAGARQAGFGLVVFAAGRVPTAFRVPEEMRLRTAQADVRVERLEDVVDLVTGPLSQSGVQRWKGRRS